MNLLFVSAIAWLLTLPAVIYLVVQSLPVTWDEYHCSVGMLVLFYLYLGNNLTKQIKRYTTNESN